MCFSMENCHPAGGVGKKAKAFSCPCTATPFHAPRIMAQKIKLMSSALFYTGYFCTWQVKHSALILPGGACYPVSPLLPQLPASLGWCSGETLFSALLGKSRAGALLSIHRWAAEEIQLNYAGASQLNAEFLFFQYRCSISS